MAENINSVSTWLASGGHRWQWGPQVQAASRVGTMGVDGAWRMVHHNGARPGRVAGNRGGPAIMQASGANQAAVDATLDGYVSAIETLRRAGTEVAWEDDQGRTGTALVVTRFLELRREYNAAGTEGWLFYRLDVLEMNGAF